MKKKSLFLVPCFILACGTQPQIKQYNLSSGVDMYFLPASTWTANDLKIDIDFNFKDDPDIETICNIDIRQKKKLPRGVSLIILTADSTDYILRDMKTLSVDSRTNTARITSKLKGDDFLKMIKSENIYLKIIIDGLKYKCIPGREFLTLRDEFQNNYFAIESLLK